MNTLKLYALCLTLLAHIVLAAPGRTGLDTSHNQNQNMAGTDFWAGSGRVGGGGGSSRPGGGMGDANPGFSGGVDTVGKVCTDLCDIPEEREIMMLPTGQCKRGRVICKPA